MHYSVYDTILERTSSRSYESRDFIVGQALPGKQAFLDYGYLLEKIILELTSMKLGTCKQKT